MVRGLLTNRPHHLSIHHHDPGNIFKSSSALATVSTHSRAPRSRRAHSQRRRSRPTDRPTSTHGSVKRRGPPKYSYRTKLGRSIVAHTFARLDRRTSGEPVQIHKILGMPLKTSRGWTAIGSEIRLGDSIGQIYNNAAECSRTTKRQNSLDRSEMTIFQKDTFLRTQTSEERQSTPTFNAIRLTAKRKSRRSGHLSLQMDL
jgi:hypothetical protein